MATITTNTTITLPAGQMLVFGLGGSATAIIDGNVYELGLGEKFFGPFTQSESVQVVVRAGAITYNIETDGAASREITQDPITRQPVSDSADTIRGAAAGAARHSGMIALRYVSAAYGTAQVASGYTFRQAWGVPFRGRCLVRAVYESNQASPSARSTAFASGRSISDNNPLNASGSAAAWKTVASVTPSTPTNVNTFAGWGRAKTAWAMLDITPATDGGAGGYIYTSTEFAANDLCMVGNNDRPLSDYGAYVNDKLPHARYRQFAVSGSHSTSGSMPEPTHLQYAPVAWIEVIPVAGSFWGVNIGDSTSQALGYGSGASAPFNYNWAHIAANDRIADGVTVHVSNFAHEGATHDVFMGPTTGGTGRLSALWSDADFRPSFVVIQPASLNGGGAGLDSANADSAVANALQWCRALRDQRIIPILRTIVPSGTLTPTQEANRIAINTAMRSSGEAVFDIDYIVRDPSNTSQILPAYQLDSTHLNAAGNEAAARHPSLGFSAVLASIGA